MTVPRRLVLLIALVLALGLPVSAGFVTIQYDTGSFFQGNLGNQGYPGGYDQLTLDAYSSPNITLFWNVPQILKLNLLTFDQTDPNCPYAPCNTTTNGSAVRTMTLNTISAPTVANPFVHQDGNDYDTLKINQGSSVVFDLGGGQHVTVTPLALPLMPGSNPNPNWVLKADVMGEFVYTPEPAAYVVLSVGMLGVYLTARRRRRNC
jgi:hypothetical protein